jgi:CDP-diacylglycerol pyrophosphatase
MTRMRIAAAAILFLLGTLPACAEDPDALWKLVHDRCVPNQLQHATPAPCMAVELGAGVERGYVLLKDYIGHNQLLLLPTAKISGIESPAVLAPDATNYFAQAWLALPRLDALAHRSLPRDAVSLAINSMLGRSQNQLHIHIDCVAAPVRAALHDADAAIGTAWAKLPVPLAGHPYIARRVAGETLDAINPFRLLADTVAGAVADMGHHTLVVVGATMADGTPGFILLDDHADAATGDFANGEELQDHACGGV